MTFLWVNKRDWRHPGPIVNVAVRNAHCLAARGLETHLVLGAGPAGVETAGDLRGFYGVKPVDTLHVHRVSRRPLLPGNGPARSFSVFLYAVRLARQLARGGPVAVISRETAFLPYLTALRWLGRGRIRCFYEAHDFYADLSWRAADQRPLKSQDQRQRWLERCFVPRLDGIIAITAPQQALYAKLFPRLPGIALPLGTAPQVETVSAETRRAERRLVYVGHLNWQKGVNTLLAAGPRLARAGVRLALWGGYGVQVDRFLARAAAEGWGDMVEVLEFRPPEELRKDLATRASVGLVTLENTFYNRHLTCPVKALDYLSHGLPAVASDLPTTRGVLGDGGAAFYLPPGFGPDALTEATLRLLDDPGAYAHAAEAARTRAAELNWETRAGRLLEFVSRQAGNGA